MNLKISIWFLIFYIFFAYVLFIGASAASNPGPIDNQINVCFTPEENCTQTIVNDIVRAHKSIFVQAYSLTSAPIAKALIDAKHRGVKVEVILDKSQRTKRYGPADFFSNADIPTYIDRKHAIAHNKVIIIDISTVITGSFNFTKAAQEKNAENVIILDSIPVAKKYIQNWQTHEEHSIKYMSKSKIR